MFYAAADAGDRGNARAKAVLGAQEALVTSDHILAESWLLIRHRLGRDAANRFWEALRSGAASVEHVGPADLEAAWGIATAFPDQDFSLVDLTSFAVMQRIGVLRAATFDDRFAIVRYGSRRERAFELVR